MLQVWADPSEQQRRKDQRAVSELDFFGSNNISMFKALFHLHYKLSEMVLLKMVLCALE
jgi:hypothetical protein